MKKKRNIPFKRIILILSFLLFIIVAIFYTTMKQNIIEASSTQTLLLIDKISQEKIMDFPSYLKTGTKRLLHFPGIF